MPLPCALYLDAVPYSLTDSIIGWWLWCLPTNKRYLYAGFRKRNACACGCRGWCSFRVYWELTRWQLEALGNGIYPSARFDGEPWRASDKKRMELSGKRMLYRMVVIYIKGDWSEYATTVGLPSWQDGLRPCF